MNMGKKIFIGGTGRCGTTILSKYLGSHDDIYKIPFESRFIADKDGIIDLFDGLTANYCISNGRMAIQNFLKLMDNLMRPHKTPYLGLDITRIFDEIHLRNSLDRLVEELSDGSFKGSDYNSLDRYESFEYLRKALLPVNYLFRKVFKLFTAKEKNYIPLYGYTGVYPEENIYIPKYFSNENELAKLLNTFIVSLYDNKAISEGKKHWCEDTPTNAFHFDKLSKILPGSYFLHIVRHPVAVAYSMSSPSSHKWAPDNYKATCSLLENFYEKLIVVHEACEKDDGIRYKLVKLEELTAKKSIKSIIEFIGVEDKFSGKTQIRQDRIDHYKDSISKEDDAYIRGRLKKYIKYFSYE